MIEIQKIVQFLEDLFPTESAERWDNVGVLCGRQSDKTDSVLISVDLTEACIEEAKARGAKLIINHHPAIFGDGLSRVPAEVPIFRAIESGIAVYAAHTNFDRCGLEVGLRVAKGLGAEPLGRLTRRRDEQLFKLTVFTPEADRENVEKAVFQAGAGRMGNYDQCSFSQDGIGNFRPLQGAHPSIGKLGKRENVKESRLEVLVPAGLRMKVLRAMEEAHSYEQPAWDLYSIQTPPSSVGMVPGMGYGFWGDFSTPRDFSDVLKKVKNLFEVEHFLLTKGIRGKKEIDSLRRVAYCPGKGTGFLGEAMRLKCDLFLTGEVGYHAALGARRSGLSVVELGHRKSEKFFPPVIGETLAPLGVKCIEWGEKDESIQEFVSLE